MEKVLALIENYGYLVVFSVTARDDGSWEVRTEGASRATSVHDSKKEAVSSAKKLAGNRRPSQLLVYKKDGTVHTEQTYG